MTKAIEYCDVNWEVQRPAGCIFSSHKNESWGYVVTKYGIVGIRSWENNASFLTIIIDGQLYERRYNNSFTQRSLVTKANRFAKEVTESN